jgi:Fis family transcriptional regulator
MSEVEPPLFKSALEYTEGNQSVAADILGISRATLRKKIKQYRLNS